MNNVTNTSKKAYKQVKESGSVKSQAREILDALRDMDYLPTANELNKEKLDLNIPNGRVHARLNKLKDKDLVVEAGKRKDNYSDRESMTWMAKPVEKHDVSDNQ